MKMIKTMLIGFVAFFATVSVFAAGSYRVEKITGRATYEAGGVWKNIEVGQELAAGTNINTALNSSLVVNDGSSSVTIKAMQKGDIEKLAVAGAGKGGLKRASVAKNTVAGKSNGAQSGVSTASSRASEAKGDLEWEE